MTGVADSWPKRGPRALQLAIQGIKGGVGGGLYIGDTGDDLDLVLNYRASKNASEPDMLAAMLVHEHEAATYQERGADFIVGSVADVIGCFSTPAPSPALPRLNSPGIAAS